MGVTDHEYTLDEIDEILGVRKQKGPLRIYDTEMRCTSPRCGSPTYYKVQGMPKCHVHALNLLNELLIEKGIDG